ncbi:tRNA (guanine(26)-N(2))-dimethyltransferase-like isoform X2 [Corticium candelabrum]|uniref:tRNA (guanine(26)-N(2))-dimethyltransferase-like isoform X2 n=1 Tax=Corticium candelabrum TaxID=121492 RepID=UPI002E35B382|nr:tRNA (guanine(26)-N(2))-dimethyltransferase-like isoform X2 [Corticium candelabrum]
MEPDETIATAAAASTCSSLPTDRHLDSSGTNSTLIDESKFSTIQEGKATILFPKTEEVFYNPVQEFNRDLSVAVIRQFSERHAACSHNRKKRRNESDSHLSAPPQSNRDSTASASSASLHQIRLTILEALSATGLRSVRYALEIPSINKIVANDISPEAVELIKTNVAHNKVEDLVTPNCADASVFMYQHRWSERPTFDVVDLDPYGSPARFLDPGIQAVKDGGLLCVTCTDMGVLCGNRGEAAFAKYGVMPLRGVFCHEMALRLVLACIQGHAARYKRYIIPLLSVSIDFYIRIFVQVFSNASEVRASASKLAYVYHCVGCESFYLQPVGKMIGKEKYSPGTGPPVGQKCDQCGSLFRIGGPMWKGPIHDFEFVEKVLDHVKGNKESYHTGDRIAGILTVIAEELPDAPLFYELDKMSGFLHCVTPGMLSFRSALLDLGYDVSFSHCQKQAVKTNAPPCVLWDIMRCWVSHLVAYYLCKAHN